MRAGHSGTEPLIAARRARATELAEKQRAKVANEPPGEATEAPIAPPATEPAVTTQPSQERPTKPRRRREKRRR